MNTWNDEVSQIPTNNANSTAPATGKAQPGNRSERTTIILPRNAPYNAEPSSEWSVTRKLSVSNLIHERPGGGGEDSPGGRGGMPTSAHVARCGSSRSLSPSPSRFAPSTTSEIISPG